MPPGFHNTLDAVNPARAGRRHGVAGDTRFGTHSRSGEPGARVLSMKRGKGRNGARYA